MAHVVSLVQFASEGAQDARGHCPLLAAYVYYAFDCLAQSPASQVVSVGGDSGHKKYLGEKHPKQKEGMCKGPEATGLAGLCCIGEREREFCTQPQDCGLYKFY